MKRIAKMPYTLESAEEFEQAYLHLAHLYVDRGKFDLAQVSALSRGGILPTQSFQVYRNISWADDRKMNTSLQERSSKLGLAEIRASTFSQLDANTMLPQDLCRRCLSYNKSCPQAWETMGLVMEKEQSYRSVLLRHCDVG